MCLFSVFIVVDEESGVSFIITVTEMHCSILDRNLLPELRLKYSLSFYYETITPTVKMYRYKLVKLNELYLNTILDLKYIEMFKKKIMLCISFVTNTNVSFFQKPKVRFYFCKAHNNGCLKFYLY